MIAEMKFSPSKLGSPKAGTRGFGLVEVIVAVCVLGVMTAIAVPAISKVTDSGKERRNMRVAQEFAMIANNAMAAGSTAVSEASSVAEALELLVNGVEGEGIFEGTEFRLPNVSIAEQNAAAHHLILDGGILVYQPRESRGGRPSR